MKTLRQVFSNYSEEQLEQLAQWWGVSDKPAGSWQQNFSALAKGMQNPVSARFAWEQLDADARQVLHTTLTLSTTDGVPRDAHRRKITRRAVFARDSWTCQYCGSRSNLTVDHVIPRSKGGTSSWDNIVASCAPCNRRKGDRLPRQANMVPRNTPRTPHPEVFIHVASPTIPPAWKQYLPQAA